MINVKKITTVILTFTLVLLFAVPALAADLNEVTFADSKITVSGSCTTNNQVQVIVFDYNNQPIFFSTVDVVQNSFSKTLDAAFDLEAGKTYTVKVADYNGKNVSTDTFTVESEEPSHTHSFGNEWKSDDTNHWHECTCGEKTDTAAHTYGEWTTTKQATASVNGSKERTCSVCGHKETAVIVAAGTSPQTGDTSNLFLWISLSVISGGTLATLGITKKRKKQNAR